MGKANRTKRADQEAKQLAAEQKKQAQAAAQKKARRNKIIGIVCAVLAVALVGSTLAYNKMVSSGFFMRQTIAASTENFELDQTHASYFYNSIYSNFMNSYGDMASAYFGLDTSKSLKSQSCAMLESGTWFDYFMTSAKSDMTNILLFAEEAKARGLELDKDDKKQIDEAISALKKAAKTAGVSKSYYIHATYGAGVSEKDLRDVLELSALYTKCYGALTEAYNFTSDDYNAYKKEHEDDLKQIDYATFTMTTSDTTNADDISVDILKKFVDRFKAAKNLEAFQKIAEEYLRDYMYKGKTDITDEDIKADLDAMIVKGASYVEENEFSEWAFDKSRKANNTYSSANEDGTAQYVYILTSTAAIDESQTKNVRHILLTTNTYETAEAAKAKAEEILAQVSGAGAEKFAELAAEYSEDSSAANGGLLENVAAGKTTDSFDAWLFDSARKVGDTGIVESEYGYHVVYMEGDGLKAWEAAAHSALWNEKYQEDYAAIAAKYPITFNDAALYAING